MIRPPAGITPARLFRSLLATPRAAVPVTLSFAGIVRGAFCVRALTSLEFCDARDRYPDDELRARRMGPELVAMALCDEQGERVFDDCDAVGALDTEDARVLIDAVGAALGTISPLYSVSDSAAWHAALVEGARLHPHAAIALGGSLSDAGRRVCPRPDRYFGLPLGELTDGQWMAFRAAHAVYTEITTR
mgnify:FL=1